MGSISRRPGRWPATRMLFVLTNNRAWREVRNLAGIWFDRFARRYKPSHYKILCQFPHANQANHPATLP